MKIESKSTETEKSLLGSILSKVKDGARMTDAVFFWNYCWYSWNSYR